MKGVVGEEPGTAVAPGRAPTPAADLRHVLAVLDGMDTAVLAVHVDTPALLANAAARELYALPAQGPCSIEQLSARIRIVPVGGLAPLDDDDLPLIRALSGMPVEAEVGLGRPGSPPDRRLLLRARPLTDPDGGVVGAVCTAQDLTELHARHALLIRRAAELVAINQATRAVLTEEDARRAACETALVISGAAMASLFEPDGNGELVCTTHLGADLLGLRLPERGSSVVADVFATGTPRVLRGSSRYLALDQEVVDRASTLCGVPLQVVVWLPVVSAGRGIAVLCLGFGASVAVRDHLPVLEILAAQTAVAIERQDLLQRLRTEAGSDPLTGAANRRAWDEALPSAIEDAALAGRRLSMVMLDLDHFKHYNDTHGHPAGDALLRSAVSAWSARLPPGSLLCRYGGEEFAVLLPGFGVDEAARLAEDLRRLVPDRETCSAGVVRWDGAERAPALVQRLDDALYQAKLAGRNRVHVADRSD